MADFAFIPARSGSKGLKDKNIKELCGKPLLAYSIEAAKESGKFDVIHVSTDSEEYADIARRYGADVPFLRTKELASDTASSRDAVLYSLEEYKKRGEEFDRMMVLQPTSPLRTVDDIVNAYNTFEKKNANTVISVCEVDHPPMWSNILTDDGNMVHFAETDKENRRQDLAQYYRLNGAIFLSKVDYYLKETSLYKEKCFAYIMPKERSVDIDDAFDFFMAESIMKGMAQGLIG